MSKDYVRGTLAQLKDLQINKLRNSVNVVSQEHLNEIHTLVSVSINNRTVHGIKKEVLRVIGTLIKQGRITFVDANYQNVVIGVDKGFYFVDVSSLMKIINPLAGSIDFRDIYEIYLNIYLIENPRAFQKPSIISTMIDVNLEFFLKYLDKYYSLRANLDESEELLLTLLATRLSLRASGKFAMYAQQEKMLYKKAEKNYGITVVKQMRKMVDAQIKSSKPEDDGKMIALITEEDEKRIWKNFLEYQLKSTNGVTLSMIFDINTAINELAACVISGSPRSRSLRKRFGSIDEFDIAIKQTM